jgi:hypothetical protein
MRGATVIAVVLLVGGCTTTQPSVTEIAQAGPGPTPEAAQAAVKAAFAKSLIDPASVMYQFDRTPIYATAGALDDKHTGWMMCGLINSKNRMGGYTGNENFWALFSSADGKTFNVIDSQIGDGSGDYRHMSANTLCASAYGHRQ